VISLPSLEFEDLDKIECGRYKGKWDCEFKRVDTKRPTSFYDAEKYGTVTKDVLAGVQKDLDGIAIWRDGVVKSFKLDKNDLAIHLNKGVGSFDVELFK